MTEVKTSIIEENIEINCNDYLYNLPYIFPCRVDKSPAVSRGFLDKDNINNYQEWKKKYRVKENKGKIGIICGSSNGICVIDIDNKSNENCYNGLNYWNSLNFEADTLIVQTPSGGLHYYFKSNSFPNEFKNDSCIIKDSFLAIGEEEIKKISIDVRSQNSGYVCFGPGYKIINNKLPIDIPIDIKNFFLNRLKIQKIKDDSRIKDTNKQNKIKEVSNDYFCSYNKSFYSIEEIIEGINNIDVTKIFNHKDYFPLVYSVKQASKDFNRPDLKEILRIKVIEQCNKKGNNNKIIEFDNLYDKYIPLGGYNVSHIFNKVPNEKRPCFFIKEIERREKLNKNYLLEQDLIGNNNNENEENKEIIDDKLNKLMTDYFNEMNKYLFYNLEDQSFYFAPSKEKITPYRSITDVFGLYNKDPRFFTAKEIEKLYKKISIEEEIPCEGLLAIYLCSSNKRQYKKIDFYPKSDYDPTIFNLWDGFELDKIPYKKNQEKRDKTVFAFKSLLAQVCGKDINGVNFMEQYLAHLIQKPYIKPGVCIFFLSEAQGTYKGTFQSHILKKLIGKYYVSVAKKDAIFGRFNDLAEAILVFNFDECEKLFENDAELKNITTEPTITIEEKGKSIKVINCFLRPTACSNWLNIVKISHSERRNMIFQPIPLNKEECSKLDDIISIFTGENYQEYILELFHYLKDDVELKYHTMVDFQRNRPKTQLYNINCAKQAPIIITIILNIIKDKYNEIDDNDDAEKYDKILDYYKERDNISLTNDEFNNLFNYFKPNQNLNPPFSPIQEIKKNILNDLLLQDNIKYENMIISYKKKIGKVSYRGISINCYKFLSYYLEKYSLPHINMV